MKTTYLRPEAILVEAVDVEVATTSVSVAFDNLPFGLFAKHA